MIRNNNKMTSKPIENDTFEREQNYQPISDIDDIQMEELNGALMNEIPRRNSPLDSEPIAFNDPIDFKISFKAVVSYEDTEYNINGRINYSL